MYGGGAGPEGSGRGTDWGCLANISRKTESVGVARLSEVRAFMALPYWPSWVAIFALLTLMERWEAGRECLERDCAPVTDSDQRATKSPSS